MRTAFMRAMIFHRAHEPLSLREQPDPLPAPNEIRVRVSACGVCRTDLHILDGDLSGPKLPLIPGHEIVGRIDQMGRDVRGLELGERVGIPWLGSTCGTCPYCIQGRENLCDRPEFTGYTRNGGYATHAIADASSAIRLGETGTDVELAPLLCAGLIGWRSFVKAGDARTIGIYGFGAAGHIVAQVAKIHGRRVFAFTRPGDAEARTLAIQLGVDWVGASNLSPPDSLDSAIIYAPVGALVPMALKATRKGGRVICAGIHMSDIPGFPYSDLWGEREIVSVANLTRQDGIDFFDFVRHHTIKTTTTSYPLEGANQALADLREGRLLGAAVLHIGG
jgi:propanol-preferring alcohol dehydrogenase